MEKYTKSYKIAAILLSVLLFSSCSDISDPKNVKAYKLEAAAATSVVHKTEPDEQPEDDTQEAEIIIQTDFTTTAGEAYSEAFITTVKPETSETTFPIQTKPEEILTADVQPTGEVTTTTALPETTAAAAPVETTEAAAPGTTAQTTAAPAGTTAAAQADGKTYNVIGQNSILVTYYNGHYMGIMPCFGTYTLCETWAKNVDRFAKELPGVAVYNMVVPTSSEFYTPQAYWDSGFTTKQKNKIDHVRQNLSAAVKDINVYDTLEQHKDECIFARTDHHWMPLGAYYAAEVFANEAGVDFPPLRKYDSVVRGGYVGSMYTYSKDVHLYNDAETFTLYISPNADEIQTTYYNTAFANGYKGDLFVSRNAASFYCSFLGTDMTIAKIETNVKNGRTLVIFKESYGNGLVPFLTSSFENIYVCDIRYFDLNAVQFCKDVGATDLLFAVCTYTAAGGNGNYLKQILG